MLKHAAALLAGSLYIAGASWLVQAEGRRYRAAHNARTVETTENPPPIVRPPRHTAAVKPIEPERPRPPEPGPAREALVAKATPDTPRPVVVPIPATATTIAPAQPAAATPAPTIAPSPPHWSNALDLARLEPDQEARLGQELNARIRAEIPVLDEGDFLERVELAARSVLGRTIRDELPYRFTVLDSDALDAFSHPGGYVYICRGVFDVVAEGEEPILEFVVEHELGHLELGHAVKLVQPGNAAAKRAGMTTLDQFLLPLVFAYPDQQEYDADAWVYQKMVAQAGRSPHEALTFLKRFKTFAERHKFPGGHKEPERGAIAFENHFRAHPAAWKRLQRLTTAAAAPARP